MSFENLAPADANGRLEEGWTFVDVRTVPEFEEGHVPGSFNVPIYFRGPMGMEPNAEFQAVIERLFPRETRLVFT